MTATINTCWMCFTETEDFDNPTARRIHLESYHKIVLDSPAEFDPTNDQEWQESIQWSAWGIEEEEEEP